MEAGWRKYLIFFLRRFWIIIGIILSYFIISKGIFYIMPFIVATVIALLIDSPVSFLEKKFKIKRAAATLIILLIFVSVFGTLVALILYRIFSEMVKFTKTFPSSESIMAIIQRLLGSGQIFFDTLHPDIVNVINKNLGQLIQTATGYITSALQTAIDTTIGLITSLPSMLIFLLVTLISTFFITRDKSEIVAFLLRQMPKGWEMKLQSVKHDLAVALVGFFKAQAILISITFVLLLVGYTLMGLEYALFVAVLTSFVDALPVLGSGSVLIPWAIVNILMQNYPFAIKLIVLYGVILVVRQILEPKLIGRGLGLHPLIALMSMYVGLQLFGVGGLIIGPVLAIIVKALQKARILPQWK